MPNKQTLTPHKKILIAVNSLEDAFENSLSNKSSNIIYIKTTDLRGWAENQDGFVTKVFGDRISGLSLNFMFKEGDKEFERENLENKILEFKRLKFLQQILNVKDKRDEQNI